MKELRGAEIFVQSLVDEGVECVFGYPGGAVLHIYDALYDYLKPASIPEAVLVIGEYQYKAAFVADQEINLVAFLTELMMRCEFK